MIVQDKLYTVEDLWQLAPAEDDVVYELDEGMLIEMSQSGDTHGELVLWLSYLIFSYIHAHDLGAASGAETGYRLASKPDILRAPDLGFIAKARLTPRTGKFYPIPPDFALEVVSSTDTARQIRRKTAQYLRAGTRLVWVVYPDDRLVDVYRPGQPVDTLESNDTLDGGDVFPGFRLPVADIFKHLRD